MGNILWVDIEEEAQQCGLGTFLMMLCLVDSDMNGNVNGPLAANNDAINALDIPRHQEQHDWVKAHCQSIWTLLYGADKGAAKGYFKAAVDTGFSQMMVALPISGTDNFEIHGPARTQYWKEHYDKDTGLILQLINVDAARWFFCKPV